MKTFISIYEKNSYAWSVSLYEQVDIRIIRFTHDEN